MKPNIEVTVDPQNLLTTIVFINNKSHIADMRLLFSSYSSAVSYMEASIALPWPDFKRCLVPFSKQTRKFKLNVGFDELAGSLIKKYSSDRKSIQNHTSDYNIIESEISDTLQKLNFDRILKPEQLRDTAALLNLNHGANFSVPGAGKTTTILAVHYLLRSLAYCDKLFVVAPINAFIAWDE
ncbi:hypothetical protein ACFL45_03120, partial [Candidatus Neomarinimicrobiota bacterium]